MAGECTCPKACDCQDPDGEPKLRSNHCPVHNLNPDPWDDCPVHDIAGATLVDDPAGPQDQTDPFYQGMNAYDNGDMEWTNPHHPSLQQAEYHDWKDGFLLAREQAQENPPGLQELLGL